MKIRFLSFSIYAFMLLFLSQHSVMLAQNGFNATLSDYVRSQYLSHGQKNYDRERFLVGLVQVTNEELRSRLGDVKNSIEKYFKSLEAIQSEVRKLKTDFGGPGNYLYDYSVELDNEIESAIQNGAIDKSQKSAFEDALQLLTLAARNPGKSFSELTKNQKSSPQLESMKKALATDQGSVYTPAVKRGEVTLYSLYREWKRTEVIDYFRRYTDVQVIRKKMFKKSSPLQKQQMLQLELTHALDSFNHRQYDYAARFLEEILNFYPKVKPHDDILFYIGESYFALGQNLTALEKGYKPLIKEYPSSSYLADAYMRSVQIAYNFKKFGKVEENARQYFATATAIHRGMDDVLLLSGIAQGRNNKPESGIALLEKINNKSPYFYLSQIISANLHSSIGDFENAQKIYNRLLSSKSIPLMYRDQAIAYSGLTYFQAKQYDLAERTLKKISPEFGDYDMILMCLAWSDYKLNMALPKSKRDFSVAQKNATFLLDNIFGSEYELEAKSLLAQMKELEGNIETAVGDYQEIEKYNAYGDAAQGYVKEREGYRNLRKKAESVLNKSMQTENQAAYEKALNIEKSTNQILNQMTFSDYSASGGRYTNEIGKLNKQVKEAQTLKKRAEKINNQKLIDMADKVLFKLYRTMNSMSLDVNSKFGYNYFDTSPVAKLEAEKVNQNEIIERSREFITDERETLLKKRESLQNKIDNAKRRRDFKTVIYNEIYLEEIDEILKRMDRVSTAAYKKETADINSNVKGWADFGAYGIVNSRIMEKEHYQNSRANYGQKIIDLNQMLSARKTRIENKIFRINEEIALMTRKVKEQRRRREREEKFREFEESYFDRRESETELQGTGTEIQDQSTPVDEGIIQDQPGEIKDEAPGEQKIEDQIPADQPAQDAPATDDLQKELENLPGGSKDEK